MNSQPQRIEHFGLFFSAAQAQLAQTERDNAPFQAAWAQLQADPPPDVPRAGSVWGAYRWRLLGDTAAGAAAVAALPALLRPQAATHLEAVQQTVTNGALLEMLRDHPAFAAGLLAQYAATVSSLLAEAYGSYLEQAWHMTLRVTAGIILEDAALFEAGAAAFERIIADDIHPEGYIRPAVAGKTGKTYAQMMQVVSALALAAEAAEHVGAGLWQVENRGVSVNTAAAYLVYYYFYPEKWRWDEAGTLTPEATRALFQQQGAFMEIVTHRGYPRGVELLLDQQRPFFGLDAGGLTTLTHGQRIVAPKKRGWFG